LLKINHKTENVEVPGILHQN